MPKSLNKIGSLLCAKHLLNVPEKMTPEKVGSLPPPTGSDTLFYVFTGRF